MIERIEVNLLSAEYRIHGKNVSLQREIVYPLLILVIAAVVITSISLSLDSKIDTLKHQINETNKEITRSEYIRKELKNLKKQKKLVEKKLNALELINVNREKWIRLQEVFCKALPNAIWIEKIEEKHNASTKIEINGKTLSFVQVAVFMKSLLESNYIDRIELLKIEQMGISETIYNFGLLCEINEAGNKVNDPPLGKKS